MTQPSRELEAQKQLRVVRAYQEIFTSEQGRLILRDLSAFAKFYTNNQSDSHAKQSHYEGRKSMILQIMGMMEFDEEAMEDLLTLSEEPNHYD